MKTLSLVAFNRPDYTGEVLEALANCRMLNDFDRFIVCIDPGDPRVVEICQSWACKLPVETLILVNRERLGVAGNPLRAYTTAVEGQGSDFHVAIEDDAKLSPDALELALWFNDQHGSPEARYAFLNLCDHYQYRGSGFNRGKVADHPSLLAESTSLSSPFAWCFTRHAWPFIKRNWNRNNRSISGWDWSLRFAMRMEGKRALTPVLSRCKNIGQFAGTHETATTYRVQLGLRHSDGSYSGPFTIVNPVSDADCRRLETWMISELPRFFGKEGENYNEQVLILTPVKDAESCIEGYSKGICALTYPHHLISIGLLESDSSDNSYSELSRRMPELRREFRDARLWKKDFGYHIPIGMHRSDAAIQARRREVLAKSRNHLLSRALTDQQWVLWLDVDLIEYSPDIIQRLLATGKDIVQPHCVLDYGGPTFDQNGWRDHGRFHLDALRHEDELVELDAVGGTMLLIRADVHRDGLIFPPFHYGLANGRIREGGEIETEGLGVMAHDMGYECWGMPHLEIRHRRW